MKKLFCIQDTPANKIAYFLLLLLLASLPYDRFYSEVLLIGFSVHTLLHIRHAPLHSLKNRLVWIPASAFTVTAFGLLYTPYPGPGWDLLARQSAIFIFPLMLGITRLQLFKYKDQLLLAFSLSCTMAVLYLFIHAFEVIWYNHLSISSLSSDRFINQYFSEPLGINATYLSMYLLLSQLFFLNRVIAHPGWSSRLLSLGCIGILGAGLIQLGSKSVVISGFLCIAIIIPFFLSNAKTRKIYYLFCIGVLAAITLLILSIPALHSRYITGFQEDLLPRNYHETRHDPRLSRWLVALELIRKKPVYGYGTGSEIPLLEKAYYEHQLYFSYYYSLNTHNQYLSIALSTGCLGMLVFAGTLLAGLQTAVKRKDMVFTCFMVTVIIVCFAENILSTNKSIFFYSSLFSLFMLTENKKLKYVRNESKIATEATKARSFPY